ncbi:MAG: hypothetical protein V1914_02535 [archaeon]
MANQPIKKFKSGSIQGAIWLNEKDINGDKIGFKTVSLRRSWKDKETDQWKDETINLRKTDIPKMLVILNKIQEEIFLGDDNE